MCTGVVQHRHGRDRHERMETRTIYPLRVQQVQWWRSAASLRFPSSPARPECSPALPAHVAREREQTAAGDASQARVRSRRRTIARARRREQRETW